MKGAKPLKQQWFHILLSLVDEERHGYGIQRAVLEQTGGTTMLWPAMLYRSLDTLREMGLVCRTSTPDNELDDNRRQYYALTTGGHKALGAEIERMTGWIEAARGKRAVTG